MKKETNNRILIIDSEVSLGDNVAEALSASSLSVAYATTYQEAFMLLNVVKLDMVILPYTSEESLHICYLIRNIFSVPIILVGKESQNNMWGKALLEAEADFYMKCPINTKLLASIVKAILRRYSPKLPKKVFYAT